MRVRKSVMGVLVGAGLLVLGACGADDDDSTGGAGSTAMLPIGAGANGGVGGGAVGVSGASGNPGTAGVGAPPVVAGSGGMGGAGGMGGMGGSAGAGMLMGGAIAELNGIGGQMLTGTATFTQAGMNISLVIMLTDCTNGVYPVHIHDAASCDSATALGEHWGGMRGEGIPAIVCDGDAGMQTHMRMGAVAEKKWTVGTSAPDDVIGHVVVLHGASGPIACGVIKPR